MLFLNRCGEVRNASTGEQVAKKRSCYFEVPSQDHLQVGSIWFQEAKLSLKRPEKVKRSKTRRSKDWLNNFDYNSFIQN